MDQVTKWCKKIAQWLFLPQLQMVSKSASKRHMVAPLPVRLGICCNFCSKKGMPIRSGQTQFTLDAIHLTGTAQGFSTSHVQSLASQFFELGFDPSLQRPIAVELQSDDVAIQKWNQELLGLHPSRSLSSLQV